MKIAIAAGLLAAACSVQATEIYNNGPVVNAAGLSILPDDGSMTLGWGNKVTTGHSMADDFTVPLGQVWNITSLDLYGFSVRATSNTFQSVVWNVIAGPDVNTGTVLASGTTTLTDGGIVGYRVDFTAQNSTDYAIYDLKADIPDISLDAGRYWLTWGYTVSSGNGYVPPVSDGRVGNAMTLTSSGYVALTDVGTGISPELPFALQGSVSAVPEPTPWSIALAGGLVVLGIARRSRKNR